MEEELLKLIRSSKIFSSLDEKSSIELSHKFEKVTVNQGDTLFLQGDLPDSVYLLISGKLFALLTTATGETKVVGHIEPGETVGEAGALTNEPRSLTIKALKDCVLFKLRSSDFIHLCHMHPTVMFATIHPVIARSRSLIQMLSAEKINKHIVLVPAHRDIPIEKFIDKLNTHIEKFPNLIIFSDFDVRFNRKDLDLNELRDKIQILEKGKKGSRKLLYILKSADTQLAKVALKKADMIYVIAHSMSTPKIDLPLAENLKNRRVHFKNDPNLILLHPEGTIKPHNTSIWLAQAQFEICHHVRINLTKDYQRLVRFIRGKAVGLVLSGGGTRGWAHLGIIKALRDAKIPIDIIGGTSAGAIVAACYAIHESYLDACERLEKIVSASTGSISWRHLTWPAISLFNAKKFTDSQIEVFDNMLIEDLWLPFFCVSCNLATNGEEIHRKGLLWERTRASSSIPGIIPPMVINGELHLDGGLLNNLPSDIMRKMIGKQAKIIAAEISSFNPDPLKYSFPPILTFTQTLLAKLGFGSNKYKFPRFVDTFMRGVFLGSQAKSKQNSLAANMLIILNLSHFRLLHANKKQANKLIELGYEGTMNQINQLKYKRRETVAENH